MAGLSFEKHKELEEFFRYLDEINHQVGAGKAVKADSPIDFKIGERTLLLPLNSETFNALYNVIFDLLNE